MKRFNILDSNLPRTVGAVMAPLEGTAKLEYEFSHPERLLPDSFSRLFPLNSTTETTVGRTKVPSTGVTVLVQTNADPATQNASVVIYQVIAGIRYAAVTYALPAVASLTPVFIQFYGAAAEYFEVTVAKDPLQTDATTLTAFGVSAFGDESFGGPTTTTVP